MGLWMSIGSRVAAIAPPQPPALVSSHLLVFQHFCVKCHHLFNYFFLMWCSSAGCYKNMPGSCTLVHCISVPTHPQVSELLYLLSHLENNHCWLHQFQDFCLFCLWAIPSNAQGLFLVLHSELLLVVYWPYGIWTWVIRNHYIICTISLASILLYLSLSFLPFPFLFPLNLFPPFLSHLLSSFPSIYYPLFFLLFFPLPFSFFFFTFEHSGITAGSIQGTIWGNGDWPGNKCFTHSSLQSPTPLPQHSSLICHNIVPL